MMRWDEGEDERSWRVLRDLRMRGRVKRTEDCGVGNWWKSEK
jgi:hypothetical protein